MQIDEQLITYLENLSQLSLENNEKDRISQDLKNILGNMTALSTLDTIGVLEMSHPFDNNNAFRDDVIQQSFTRKDILQNATVKNDEMFIVPKTVE